MLILTGDVHHQTLRTNDQRYLKGTEPASALRYADIVASYGAKATLFLTGKVGIEEPEVLKRLAMRSHLEIAGHTYNAYQPLLFHRISKKLLGQFMGPKEWQRWSIRQTCDILSRASGQPVVSWRNHAYLSDEQTVPLLREEGLLCYSDIVQESSQPFSKDGLLYVPINVIPDHEHLYHAHRTPETVESWAKKTRFGDSWGSGSFDAKRWGEMVVQQTRSLVERGKTACLLIHPACMEALDDFKTFDWIMQGLADLPSAWMREVL
ncbi:MAG: polysaccharide deacetylase family protein [Myxococcales bacterium]|nr:polysaccharide deacetylase family protein [Myxococcales bacterium]MCB9642594.1 polysaccharide deacetylase family protein [Myxococcales bacterium]